MANQCNICGSFTLTEPCLYCPAFVCQGCKRSHGPYCDDMQKLKHRGAGPTIANAGVPVHRAGHETPPTTEPDRRFYIPSAAPIEVLPPPPPDVHVEQQNQGAAVAPIDPTMIGGGLAPAPLSVDTGLAAINDLLEGQ